MPVRALPLALATGSALLLVACQSAPPAAPVPPTTVAAVGELRPGTGVAKGYLDRKQLPDSVALLPRRPTGRPRLRSTWTSTSPRAHCAARRAGTGPRAMRCTASRRRPTPCRAH